MTPSSGIPAANVGRNAFPESIMHLTSYFLHLVIPGTVTKLPILNRKSNISKTEQIFFAKSETCLCYATCANHY